MINGDLSGLVPVEATRLEASAEADSLICSDLVRALAGSQGPYGFIDPQELQLKGLRDPVRAWRVSWRPQTTSQQLGLPEPLTLASRLPFVGRGDEVDRLTSWWTNARQGDGRLVTVAGEPGVGKTRLCSELAERTMADGGIVLYGRCDQLVPYPYQPVVEALERFVGHTQQLELLPVKQAAELARLVPAIRDQLPDLGDPEPADSDTQRYHLFEAVTEWLLFLAREDPVLVVIDDLTWATRQRWRCCITSRPDSPGFRCSVSGPTDRRRDPTRCAMSSQHCVEEFRSCRSRSVGSASTTSSTPSVECWVSEP